MSEQESKILCSRKDLSQSFLIDRKGKQKVELISNGHCMKKMRKISTREATADGCSPAEQRRYSIRQWVT